MDVRAAVLLVGERAHPFFPLAAQVEEHGLPLGVAVLGQERFALDPQWVHRPELPGQEARNLDVAEAAKRLGMSRDWLYRNASKLPFAVRIGRRVVFDSLALERWNQRHAER